MKRIVLTLGVFIALVTVANAVGLYKCVDSNGNIILTDNPPPDAKCEGMGGDNESTPSEAAAWEIDRKTEAANREIDKQIEEIDKQIKSLSQPIRGISGKFFVPTKNLELVNELMILKADIIMKAQRLDAEMRNPQDAGLKMRNQQDEMETKMKRQQREMEAKTKEMKAKKDAMEAKMRSQELEIQDLEREKRMSEHNQGMQELKRQMGQ